MKPEKIVSDNGRVEYRLNGELHREDGPAIIDDDYKEWWVNGLRQT